MGFYSYGSCYWGIIKLVIDLYKTDIEGDFMLDKKDMKCW